MNSITKKWRRGSLLTTLLVLLLAEGLFLFQSYNLYYGGVRQAVNSRFASISGQLKMYTGDEKATQSQRRSQALRRMVEQFDEKDKFEFTLLDAGGQVLASSSGRAGELSSLEDFQQAMASPDGRGEAIYRSAAGERVLAITILTPYQACASSTPSSPRCIRWSGGPMRSRRAAWTPACRIRGGTMRSAACAGPSTGWRRTFRKRSR